MSLPWHIDTAMYSIVLFDIGYRMKAINIKDLLNRIPIIVGVLLSVLFVLIGDIILPVYPFNTSINEFANEPLTLLFNIIGIGTLLFVSNVISPNWYLSYLGQNSLILFYIHIPFVVYGYKIINYMVNLKLSIFDNSLFGVGYIFIITLLLYPICRLLNKFPVLTGKGRIIEGLLESRREL